MEKTVSIIVTAYNEEKEIEATVNTIRNVLDSVKNVDDVEILLIDNASVDSTPEIVDRLAQTDHRIKVAHLYPNVGFGGAFWEGVKRAKNYFVFVLPGDNETDPRTIGNVLSRLGEADMVLSYTVNKEARSLFRRFVSFSYTHVMNLILGLRLKYYNGVSIHRRDLLLKILEQKNPTTGHAFSAVIVANLIKAGFSYVEVPQYIQSHGGKSKIFEFKNIKKVIKAVAKLFWDIRVKRDYIR